MAAVKLRLGDADRERLGLGDAWYDFEPDTFTLGEAETIEEQLGITPEEFFDRLYTRERRSAKVWRAVVWIALTRGGHQVTLAALLDVDFQALRTAASDGGKAPTDETASVTSDDATESSSSSAGESDPGSSTA